MRPACSLVRDKVARDGTQVRHSWTSEKSLAGAGVGSNSTNNHIFLLTFCGLDLSANPLIEIINIFCMNYSFSLYIG